MIRARTLNTLKGIRHGFLTRKGGTSEGLFSSLNCGYGSSDRNINVRANRELAVAKLGLCEDNLVTLHQVHSAFAVHATKRWELNETPRADAIVTRTRGLALGILTADCVPVLFADRHAGVIAAAHAGWKGALNGIIKATLQSMKKLGARPENTVAAIGPCICQSSYEVGSEFRKVFTSREKASKNLFLPSTRKSFHMFNLPGFVINSLIAAGVGSIDDVECDTYKLEELFFSYRRSTHRSEKDYGRSISLIALE